MVMIGRTGRIVSSPWPADSTAGSRPVQMRPTIREVAVLRGPHRFRLIVILLAALAGVAEAGVQTPSPSALHSPAGRSVAPPWLLFPGAGLLLVGLVMVVRRMREGGEPEPDLPPLVFSPVRRATAPQPLRPEVWPAPAAAPVAPSAAPLRHPPPPVTPEPGATTGPEGYAGADDPTVQLLPGRLEIVVGEGRGREFRFVRARGRVTEVTIGRQSGSPESHVRLAAPTVSRLHARLRFESGGWHVENLSQTNPLALNGQPLSEAAASPLHDGDQLEVGEYVLVFHER